MKKLLGLTGLAALFVLAACGGSDTVTTSCEVDAMGMEMTMTAESEDGEITSIEAEVRMPLAMLGVEAADVDLESDELADMLAGMGFDGDVDLDGDYLVVTDSGTAEELGESADLDEFIAGAEALGGTCS